MRVNVIGHLSGVGRITARGGNGYGTSAGGGGGGRVNIEYDQTVFSGDLLAHGGLSGDKRQIWISPQSMSASTTRSG